MMAGPELPFRHRCHPAPCHGRMKSEERWLISFYHLEAVAASRGPEGLFDKRHDRWAYVLDNQRDPFGIGVNGVGLHIVL